MLEKFEHIYTSPIGRIKIISDKDCIHELIFLEETDSNVIENESPQIIHQCIDECQNNELC